MSTPDPQDWAALLQASADPLRTKGSGRLLWQGAKAAIAQRRSANDPMGDTLYRDVLAALGVERKSTASKIKTVALAVEHGLRVDYYGSLHAAYTAAAEIMRDQP